MAHILAITYPAQGHINPMLQFSKRLASKGHRVTLIIAFLMGNSIPQLQPTAGTTINLQVLYDDDGGEEPNGVDESLNRFKAFVSRTLPELIKNQLSSDHPPTVLVYDSVMPWAVDIAKELGLLSAAFFTQSCSVSAIYHHFTKEGFSPAFSASLPALPAMEIADLPSFLTESGSYPFLFSLLMDQFHNFDKADWILFNTFDKLEQEVLNWMARQCQCPIRTIGPTIPSMYLDKRLKDDIDYGLNLFTPSTESSMKWLNAREKRSVVYVSFGSLASLGEEQMEETAQGLINSNAHFLWVVRASEEDKLPSRLREEILTKGLIVNWCPQLEVLAHQAVGCFMTHCGWNSTLEALSLGVPMVAMPQWTDQTTNAKFVEDVWGVGVRAKANEKGIVTREVIEMCVKQVMEGERGDELGRAALRWRDMATEAVDEGGTSDKNIDEFISRLVSDV